MDSESLVIEHGDMICRDTFNPVTGRYDTDIQQADNDILISDQFALQAFNEPSEKLYGLVMFAPLELMVIFNGRNRQVKYKLVEHDPIRGTWHAEKIVDTDDVELHE